VDSAERAARAVREFHTMLPGLTSYVRAMTGDPRLTVRAHHITSTDGKYVNIRPPLALADRSDHDRRLCDRRDEFGEQKCPACRRIEKVYACLYHEMSHIVSGSLGVSSAASLSKYITKGLADSEPSFAKLILKNIEGLRGGSIYQAANLAHPYMVPVLRATDDYVIERNAIRARPGVEAMLYYQAVSILSRGMEQSDGSYVKWSDQPIESQIVIALLSELHGWGVDGFFAQEAVDVIRSPGVQALVQREIPTVDYALTAATAYLSEFNKLGYFVIEPPEENETEDDPAQDSTDSSEGDPSGYNASGGSGDGDSDNSSSETGQSDDQGDSGSGTADDTGSDADEAEESGDGDSGGLDSEHGPDVDSVPDSGDSNGDPSDSAGTNGGSGVSDNLSGDSGTDDQEIPAGESEKVSGDDAQDNSEPSDAGSGDGSSSDVDGPDSDGDVGSGPGDGGSSGTAPDAGSGDDNGASDAPSGSGNSPRSPATPSEISEALDQATGHEQNEKMMDEGYEAPGTQLHHGHDAESDGDDENFVARPGSGGNPEDGLVDIEELENALVQALHFDDMSTEVGKLVIRRGGDGKAVRRQGSGFNFEPLPESIIAGSVNRARRVFHDNALDKHENNLKSGKLSARSLGARGWGDDKRVFRKKIRAHAKSYEVVIGMDVSGSTSGEVCERVKRSGMAMADLLNRLGVPFSIYAHTTSSWSAQIDQEIYAIKTVEEPWTEKAKDVLRRLKATAGSLDGHNFEFYRKVLMRSKADRRLCIYYTDGAIPETNHYEELGIMERESKMYRRFGFESLIVAVNIALEDTYGFDQVHLDDESDMATVLRALERKLSD
jgi:hypothetical protein